MPQLFDDLTLSEVLKDPMILAVAKADGVSADELGRMLHAAAGSLKSRISSASRKRNSARCASGTPLPAPLPGLLRSHTASAQCCAPC